MLGNISYTTSCLERKQTLSILNFFFDHIILFIPKEIKRLYITKGKLFVTLTLALLSVKQIQVRLLRLFNI